MLALLALTPSIDPLRELQVLVDHRQFFELRAQLATMKTNSTEELYFRAVLDEKLNRLEQANRMFERYLAGGGKRAGEARRDMASNYARLGQYAKAGEMYNRVLKEPNIRDAGDIRNVAGLWSAIDSVPPQRVRFEGDTDIPLTRDFNVELEGNGQKLKFIFDTGANISTVSETFANKLGLRLYDTKVLVGGITGAQTPARLGVAKEIRLGNVVVNNAVFLVFPDKALYIEAAKFQLNGILGFPVISALRELTLTKAGRLQVPKMPKAAGLNNLVLDGLSPLVLGHYGTRRFTFALDTGANVTMLYPPFYRALEHEVSNYEKTTHRFAGVGSARSVPAYAGKNLKLGVGGREVIFPRVPILTETTSEASKVLFGNLGQDMIRQFESMTINFEKMSVEFGPRAR